MHFFLKRGHHMQFDLDRKLAATILALGTFLNPGTGYAQAWPTRNVTIIVPLAAGTGMDTLVRLYSDQLSKALGKPVIVDNRPGAALMLGVTALSKAPPDWAARRCAPWWKFFAAMST